MQYFKTHILKEDDISGVLAIIKLKHVESDSCESSLVRRDNSQSVERNSNFSGSFGGGSANTMNFGHDMSPLNSRGTKTTTLEFLK